LKKFLPLRPTTQPYFRNEDNYKEKGRESLTGGGDASYNPVKGQRNSLTRKGQNKEANKLGDFVVGTWWHRSNTRTIIDSDQNNFNKTLPLSQNHFYVTIKLSVPGLQQEVEPEFVAGKPTSLRLLGRAVSCWTAGVFIGKKQRV